MTTINEAQTAKGYTPAASVPQVFGRPRTIDGIVIHHWGVTGQTHDGVVNFFVNGPGQTSAHFVVSAGRIECLVSPLDAAWHSGNAVGNATTIGIECRPEATDEDYATVAELVAYLRSEYGPLPLSPHRQWQSTACPGVWDLNRINQLAGSAAIAPQSTTTKELFTMGQYEELSKKLDKIANTAQNTWAGVWDGGTAPNGKKFNYGILPIVAESQRRDNIAQAQIAGLVGAIAALSKGEKFDEAKLLAGVQAAAEAGVKAGIADGTVTVDVNVNGAAA
jgi:hypothetical protein